MTLEHPCKDCRQQINTAAEKAWLDENVPRLRDQVSYGVIGTGPTNWHSTHWQCVAATMIARSASTETHDQR